MDIDQMTVSTADALSMIGDAAKISSKTTPTGNASQAPTSGTTLWDSAFAGLTLDYAALADAARTRGITSATSQSTASNMAVQSIQNQESTNAAQFATTGQVESC